jgi:amino acid adenylation domain-containing protein
LLSLLRDALARPQAPVDALELLDPREQQRLLQTYAQTRTSYSQQGLHHLFEAQAAQRGRELAVICGQESLTYEQLNVRANQLAHYLRGQGVASNALVALCLPRSLDLLVALLAVLKAGGTYVPFDPDYPSARLCWQLQDLAPHILLTHESLLPQFVEWRGATLCLDQAHHLLDKWPRHNPQVAFSPDDLAYVIYTSGSTGKPKGVMIPHRAVSNYTQALCEQLAVEAGWHFATVSTLAADLGNTAIFCSLASGGCLHILPYEVLTSASALESYVQKYPLDVLKIVPSHLSALLSQGEEQHLLPRRFLLLGGEALPGSLLSRLAQAGSRCCILNHYGPTEATIGAVTNMLGEASTAASTAHTQVVPIGRSIPNMEAYILDKNQHLVPVGVVGEIYLAGSGLALGYLKSAEQTAERFVPHSFSQEPGQRMYRTGDLARYREEGVIEFVGRKDEQVKLRGYRIELKEIEAALKLHPAIEEAVVLVQERLPEDKQLVAYVVPEKHEYKTIVETEIREFLKEQLPIYMVPAEMRLLERLPLTANGKVDRAHLPTSTPLTQEPAGKLEEARTPLEEVMAGVWQEVLNVKLVGRNDNFFRLGGHSLLGMKLVSRLRAVFGVEVPITWVFEAPTVAQLASRVDDLLRGPALPPIPPLVPVSRQEELPLSFAQQRLWFLDRLEPGSTAYLMPGMLYLRSALNVAALESSLQEMMRRHESLRTTFQMRNNQPVQIISSTIKPHLLLIDLCDLSVEERLAVARIVAEQERQQPCDLARGPLLRVRVLRLNVEEHVLLSTMHHIISDGWSNEIFVRELTLLYRSFAAGLPSSLPPLPIQYADFAVWQRAWLQGEVLEKQLDYWLSQLGGASTLELRTDHPLPAMPSRRSAVQRFRLPAELSRALVALSGQEGVTLFMTLLAAFQVLLYRYTGQEDILVGTDSANRSRLETENIIGFFVNLLVLRTDLGGKPSFQEVLRRVREVVLGAYAHQDTPFEFLVEKLVSDHRPDRMPLVQVLFVLQNIPGTHEQSVEAGLPPTREELSEATPASLKFHETRTAKFDLALFIHERSEQLHGSLIYSQDLFEANTIATMIARFEVLLQSIVKHPDISVDRLEFIAENEQVVQKSEEQALLHALHKQDGEWFDLSEIDFA